MAVGQDYTLGKPLRPSAPKRFLDTQIVPAAVNAASWLEVTLDRASVRTGIRPIVILAGSMGLLSLLVFQLMRRRR